MAPHVRPSGSRYSVAMRRAHAAIASHRSVDAFPNDVAHEEPQATTGKTLPAAHLKGQRQLGAGGERVGEARKPAETRISIFGAG